MGSGPSDTHTVRVPPRALVVDDHPSFRRMARQLLAAAGFEVVAEAADAAGALRLADSAGLDLVLLDVLLPDGNGAAIADRVHRLSGALVLLTSSRSAADLGAALDGHAFVTKAELTVAGLRALVEP